MQDDIKSPPEPNQPNGPVKATDEPIESPIDQQAPPSQEPAGPKEPPVVEQQQEAASQTSTKATANPDKDQTQKPKPKGSMPIPEALKNQTSTHRESHLGPIILAIILLIFLAAVAIASETQTDF